MENMYKVERVHTVFENAKIVDKIKMGESYFLTLEAARRHAERMHKDGTKLTRDTWDDDTQIVVDIWVEKYTAHGDLLLYDSLVGHFNGMDGVGTGLVLSHCE